MMLPAGWEVQQVIPLRGFIEDLIRANAKHRKGFTLSQATPLLAASSAASEMGELLIELVLGGQQPTEKAIEEFADVWGALHHLAIMLKIPIEQLEQTAIKKLKMRFTLSGQIWPGHTCKCGHSKDDHSDEHDEFPTGTGPCKLIGCGCSRFSLKDVKPGFYFETETRTVNLNGADVMVPILRVRCQVCEKTSEAKYEESPTQWRYIFNGCDHSTPWHPLPK